MFAIELFIYLGFIVAFYVVANLHEDFKGLGIAHKIIISLFVYLLVIGQVNKSSQHTYPFAVWGMYSQVNPSQHYTEYLIEMDNGEVKHYPFETIAFTSQRSFMRKLNQFALRSDEKGGQYVIENTLDTLVQIYQKRKPDQIIVAFRINRIHIFLAEDGPGFTTSIQTEYEKIFVE